MRPRRVKGSSAMHEWGPWNRGSQSVSRPPPNTEVLPPGGHTSDSPGDPNSKLRITEI